VHKVRLIKYLWTHQTPEISSEWSKLLFEVELPFVPFHGLNIQLPDQRAWRIRDVEWNVEEQTFRCHIEDQFMNLLDVDDSYEDWIDMLLECGWELSGRYTNEHNKT
jgi:hypothetical protein